MHERSSFITLTYEDTGPSLNYPDFQRFMKRLKRERSEYWMTFNGKPVYTPRVFVCGEYGEQTLRPHFHAILFGTTFDRYKQVSPNAYASKELERLWPLGMSSVGDATYESAAYVARYVCKKATGRLAESRYIRVDARTGEYVRVVPEFAHMSLKPGIGYSFFQKYWREMYEARDGVVLHGRVIPNPRYYDQLLELSCPVLSEEKDFGRYVRSGEFLQDCSAERLAVREVCAKAKLQFLKRGQI